MKEKNDVMNYLLFHTLQRILMYLYTTQYKKTIINYFVLYSYKRNAFS